MPGDNLVVSGATGNKTGSDVGHGNFGDEQTQAIGRVAYRVWRTGFPTSRSAAVEAQRCIAGPTTLQRQVRFLDCASATGLKSALTAPRLIDTGDINAKTGDYYGFDAAGKA